MKYIKTYESNYKFKVGDYIKHIYQLTDGKKDIFIIKEIDKNSNRPYLAQNIKDESHYFWATAVELYRPSDEDLLLVKYNI